MSAEVVVHVHDAHAHLEDGPALNPEIADCLACDGPVTTVVDTPRGPIIKERRRAPSRTQRRWLALRHPHCQFPGCHHPGSFDVHHVVERRHGGPTTLANLTRLCGFHHRMVHLHRLILTLHPDRRLDVHRRDGTPLDTGIAQVHWDTVEPDDPDLIAGVWFGDRLSYPDCFDALGIPWAYLSRGKSTEPDHSEPDQSHPQPATR